jgi:hypothetical protein
LDKRKALVKLLKEHAGPEDVIALKGLVSKLKHEAWVQYDLRVTEDEVREFLLEMVG